MESALDMHASFITAMTYETGMLEVEDFPQTESPVWILGKQYSVLYDLAELKKDVKSRLWLTYRKGFDPIGGSGPTSDQGWGCMLRCGQMMLAQSLICRHLGRDWRWTKDKYDPKYFEILRMFQDKRSAKYSLQVIASMGTSEGKAIGEWFGPNTISQVLRKLCVSDEWSNLVVHVALDNTVIIDDVFCLCKSSKKESNEPIPGVHAACASALLFNGHDPTAEGHDPSGEDDSWRPLLLIVPLRLGLSEINPVYIPFLKTCLTFKQSVGIIGGKPNHAHWFIGFLEDELVYMDPHTTQPFVDVTQPGESDASYHCSYSCRMPVSYLDPSVAVGFFCQTEADFEDLCQCIRKYILHGQKTPMFELHQRRPRHWPPFDPYPSLSLHASASSSSDRLYDSEDEFELIPHPNSLN
ncbi:hypothetical protein CAPTEDRAFT_225251 [Capitella teleta]|uniref:Cysteine protease n=1 Tax=Capitella teleta TaxID=283909 RepID=R7T598_CAPTE|nr:hypothetical protein CAPTEDRAFT_225251 [Capitella teleta]|eukprot:ELT88258.1 hypothetical protein CAPTEDRAFT_225251 [Capitella teleta]